jgi:pimeloyl-ACP methyl ester carboxylesterase
MAHGLPKFMRYTINSSNSMKKFLILLTFIPLSITAQDVFSKKRVQEQSENLNILNINKNVQGTLLRPKTKNKVPLVIFIAGSGAVDRNGNEPRTRSNNFRQLADTLLSQDIASYRYDKRIFTQMKNRKVDDKTLVSDFIIDAKEVLFHFKNDSRFSNIYVLGHDQGSLVGMLAIDESVDGFISIAGAGEPIDKVIVRQIATQQPGLDKVAQETFERVKISKAPVEDIERDLYVIIGPQVQPFMKSWMQYDPAVEIARIKTPILLLNGTKNRQVNIEQTEMLQKAAPQAQYNIIDGMNHIFKKVGEDDIESSKSYIDPNFPLHPELVSAILAFVEK